MQNLSAVVKNRTGKEATAEWTEYTSVQEAVQHLSENGQDGVRGVINLLNYATKSRAMANARAQLRPGSAIKQLREAAKSNPEVRSQVMDFLKSLGLEPGKI